MRPRVSSPASSIVGAAVLIAGLALGASPASAGPVGQLFRDVSGAASFVLTSSKAPNCAYNPANGALGQHHVGTVDSCGLQLGVQGPDKLT